MNNNDNNGNRGSFLGFIIMNIIVGVIRAIVVSFIFNVYNSVFYMFSKIIRSNILAHIATFITMMAITFAILIVAMKTLDLDGYYQGCRHYYM